MSSLLASIPKTYPASLLLNFDGSNNSTIFTDSSVNNHTGTAYGNAVISTSQSKFGGSSGYFDGVGDYVEFADHASFDFGTGDFSIECWVYPSNISGTQVIWSRWNNNGDNKLQLHMAGGILYLTIGVTLITSNSFSLTPSTWSHVAIARQGSDVGIFLNGSCVSRGISSDNADSTSKFVIGANDIGTGGANYFNGYIDSLRITKGVALYTGSAHPLPNIPSSKNAVIAPKLNNHIVMISTKSSGDITGYVSTNSGYYTVNWWDGTRTIYSGGSNFSKAAIGGNQSITIYPSSADGTLSGVFQEAVISNNNLTSVRPFHSKFTTSPGGPGPSVWSRTNTVYYNSYYGGGWNRYYGTYVPGAYVPGPPYHLDVSSNNLDSSALNQIYSDLLNGNGTIDVSDNTGGDSDNPNIATAKGYTVFGSVSPYTALLLNLNSNYTDSSSQNISISTIDGSPAFSTSIKKYGSAALSLNFGSVGNDSLVIPDLSEVDYTIEFWIYRPTVTNEYEGVINLSNGNSSAGINIHLYTNNEIQFNDGQTAAVFGGTISDTTWYHVACVSRNNVKKLFIDGTLISSTTQATPIGPYKLKIGQSYGLEGYTSEAYLDDIRIIRGKALYSSSFTRPSSQLTIYP